jgi:hypothetical protein
MSYPPPVTNRIAFFLALGLCGFGCSTNDASAQDGGGDGAYDAAVDLCDLDAYAGSGNPCPHASTRVCFAQCETGGCKCTQGATGPVWKCTTDLSCLPEGSPLDDAGPDDAAVTSDGGTDASTD